MAKNNLHVVNHENLVNDIDDQRWRKNSFGLPETGQNAMLVIDAAAQALADDSYGYLLSGTPLVRKVTEEGGERVGRSVAHVATFDGETGGVAGGETVVGFLSSIAKVKDVNGDFFEEVPVGIQTGGEIYPAWLPVDIADEDIPDRFGKSPL